VPAQAHSIYRKKKYERGFRVALVFFGIHFAEAMFAVTLTLKANGNESDENMSSLR
jgi:hypothetical protein